MSSIKPTVRIIKVTIPMIITDNPMACFSTRDGSFVENVPLNSQIIRWMNGAYDKYFAMTTAHGKIKSMRPVSEKRYLASGPKGVLTDWDEIEKEIKEEQPTTEKEVEP